MTGIEWSTWMPLGTAAVEAPKEPGVYEARVAGTEDVVYVGMAGERSRNGKVTAKGLRARIKGYESGRVITNGLGGAVITRALRDPAFRALIAMTEINDVFELGKLAFTHVTVEIRWTTTADKESAALLEDGLLGEHPSLWNRRPARTKKLVKLEEI